MRGVVKLGRFAGNIGGICGVFIGFSLISIVEILYFIALMLRDLLYKESPIEEEIQSVPREGIQTIYWSELMPRSWQSMKYGQLLQKRMKNWYSRETVVGKLPDPSSVSREHPDSIRNDRKVPEAARASTRSIPIATKHQMKKIEEDRLFRRVTISRFRKKFAIAQRCRRNRDGKFASRNLALPIGIVNSSMIAPAIMTVWFNKYWGDTTRCRTYRKIYLQIVSSSFVRLVRLVLIYND